MKIKTFVFNSFYENTYLIYDDAGDAVVIDPGCFSKSEFSEFAGFIEKNSLALKKIINTHCHIDHILGINSIKEFYKVKFFCHKDESILVEGAPSFAQIFGLDVPIGPTIDGYLAEGESLFLGTSEIKPLHVPGHSPGSLCFYLPQEKILFAGDVLFQGSVGRSDLPGGNHNLLISQIRQKLLVLPPETVVYPGHGPSTTIQEEHDSNPFLS